MVLQNEPCPKNVDTADDTRERRIYRVTLYGAIANVLLCAAKLLAGVFGRSSAMIADGVQRSYHRLHSECIRAYIKQTAG